MVTAAMVGIDAEVEQPTVVSTTTTRDPITPARLREGQAQFVREVRRQVAEDARYCSFLEFTTGMGRKSGGKRRPHQHALWKGLPKAAAGEVEAIAARVWTRISGAYMHEVEEIKTPGGAVLYVAAHHQKESQAPPTSWGPTRRVRPSRGYWSMPAAELRRRASEKLRDDRLAFSLRRKMEAQNVPEDLFELVWEGAKAGSEPPEVVRVREHRGHMVEVVGPL